MDRTIFQALRRLLGSGALVVALAAVLVGGAIALGGDDSPSYRVGSQPPLTSEESEETLIDQDIAYYSRRTAGDNPVTIEKAGQLRAKAAKAAKKLNKEGIPSGPTTFAAAWAGLGPNPLNQIQRSTNTAARMSGRIGALAIRPSNGQFILGAAQGGIWLFNPATGLWSPKTDDQESLAIGALAIAPSNDAIVYAGTGEGALSGDSMFGNGILKSTDGGNTWNHVSDDYFVGVSISRIVVDPTNASHLYAAVLRGRGGARRTTPAEHSRYGVWESTDGGVSWTMLKEAASEQNGATDLEIDPLNPNILYASFWSDAMYKSTDAGQHWSPIMTGLPADADYVSGSTRFSISLSHPAGQSPVLYVGFDYNNTAGAHVVGRIWKSTNAGASWSILPDGSGGPFGINDKVADYCGTQCFYDNVIEADPTNPDIVFAAGSFGYSLHPQSGGIFRSTDGGLTWENLGWDQHPDFHALAFDPSNTNHVLMGNDGGVRYSPDRGGRPQRTQPLSDADWQNLDGRNLQITQFTSIATVPQTPAGPNSERFWGGTQDNGTLRKSTASQTWTDLASGDGGQVLVDPTTDTCALAGGSCYVYGTYYGISPWRISDGGAFFFSNEFIQSGINLADRSDFYTPWVMNLLNTNQLFLGTYRLYRTDNARATSAGSVTWKAISPDLTSGCTGAPAPNGARNCSLSAIGVGGGNGVYTGSLDGYVYVSPDAQVSDSPTWTRADSKGKVLPNRPVAQIAVDRSNYRIAYLAYDGFSDATPKNPGHVFRTLDGGQSFTDISGNLPDTSVNSLILDPSYPNTLYAGTDAGPFVTYNGGTSWNALGTSGFPNVGIWQLDLDTAHRMMAAGTHGRGAFKIQDPSTAVPSLVLSKVAADVPVGPGSKIDYTLTLRNIGSADATGVKVTDPVPANTSFVSADSGGTYANGVVTWSGQSVPKGVPGTGGSITLHLTVRINASLKKTNSIVNDGVTATSAQGPSTSGSPVITPIAPAFSVGITPPTQTDGAHAGSSAIYHVAVRNLGYNNDSYTMSSSGGTYTVTFYNSTCATPLASNRTGTLTPGATTDVCVKVAVPTGAADGDVNTATVTATSVGSSSVSASATVKTIAVTKDWLLVDGDGNKPDVQAYYSTALNSVVGAGAYSTWDLATDPNLPQGYLTAHKNVVWFTGNSYPAPITPYEGELKALLDGNGRLFMSGQDILDQAAGTTPFVRNYLHITWNGSDDQNDIGTAHVNSVASNPVTATIGTVPLDHSVLGAAFEDQITPNTGALAAFNDDTAQPDALTYAGGYKVVFLAFPLEAYGTATQKADLLTRAKNFFATP